MLLSENWDLNLEMCGNTHVGQTARLKLNPQQQRRTYPSKSDHNPFRRIPEKSWATLHNKLSMATRNHLEVGGIMASTLLMQRPRHEWFTYLVNDNGK